MKQYCAQTTSDNADYTVLVAENPEDLQNLVTQTNDRKEFELGINIRKIKVLSLGREEQIPYVNIIISREPLQEMTEFMYLGHIITDDRKCEMEINRRVGLVRSIE